MQRIVDLLEIIFCMLLLITLLISGIPLWYPLVAVVIYFIGKGIFITIRDEIREWLDEQRDARRSARQASKTGTRELESPRSAAARERVRKNQVTRDALWQRVKHDKTRRK